MPHFTPRQPQFSALLLLAMAAPLAAQASSELAIEKGCYNCHGSYLRGEAPAFASLASKLARLKGDAPAQEKFVASYRTGKTLEHVEAHERLSPESASKLVQWLVGGAK